MQTTAEPVSCEPRVFVVDDDPALRDSLRYLIESVGLRVETYATAEEFLGGYDPQWPGCLVLDVRMPGMGGLQLQEELGTRGVTLPIIIITGYAEVPTAVRAMKAGAVDFIEKPFSDQALLDRVRDAIAADQRDRALAAERRDAVDRFERLTPRERDVLGLVITGRANKVIAEDLGLSAKTVEVHRANIMRKLKVGTLAELVRLALVAESRKGKP